MIEYKFLDYDIHKLYLLNDNNFINHFYPTHQKNKTIKFRILRMNNQSIVIGFKLRILKK